MTHDLKTSHDASGCSDAESVQFSEYMSGLENATLFELFRIRSAIENILDDPSRHTEIKRQIRVGETISYFASEENRCIDAVVLKINRSLAVVKNVEDGKQWKIPFYMIILDQASVMINNSNQKGLSRNELSVGATVGFYNRDHQQMCGTIVKLNPKTVKIRCDDNNSLWRVAYSLLFRVIDGQVASTNPNIIDALSVKAIPKPK